MKIQINALSIRCVLKIVYLCKILKKNLSRSGSWNPVVSVLELLLLCDISWCLNVVNYCYKEYSKMWEETWVCFCLGDHLFLRNMTKSRSQTCTYFQKNVFQINVWDFILPLCHTNFKTHPQFMPKLEPFFQREYYVNLRSQLQELS